MHAANLFSINMLWSEILSFINKIVHFLKNYLYFFFTNRMPVHEYKGSLNTKNNFSKPLQTIKFFASGTTVIVYVAVYRSKFVCVFVCGEKFSTKQWTKRKHFR